MNLSSIYPIDQLDISRSKIAISILWLFQLSGIVGILLGFEEWFIEKTPVNLIVQLGLLFWVFSILDSKKIGLFVLLFTLGMLAEIIGVNTSYPFGEYYYGSNLGPKILGVPYLIGCNWAILVFISASLAKKLTSKSWLQALFGAVLMLSLDIPLEIIAPKFDFWHFSQGVGINNFISWFLIAFLLHLLSIPFKIEGKTSFSAHFYTSQLLFFVVFAFWVHY